MFFFGANFQFHDAPTDYMFTLKILDSENNIAGFVDLDKTWVALYLNFQTEEEADTFQFIALSVSEAPDQWTARVKEFTAATENTAKELCPGLHQSSM